MRPLILAGYVIRSRAGGPRRYLDAAEAAPDCTVLAQREFATDEELEDFHRRAPGPLRRMAHGLRLIWRHRRALREGGQIYCLDNMSFNLLLAASRLGLFHAEGKSVRRFAFHDRAMSRLLPWLRDARAAFSVDLITAEQVRRWGNEMGGHHVRLLHWRIDTDWYQPAAPAPAGPLFLPGNACRDESLVVPLLQAGHSVTRAGRSYRLAERLRECAAHVGFRLMMNAPHAEYREALRGSRAVVLPILPCDEPAGLTAAMEAIACAVPLLANRSMGIRELLEQCAYPLPMVESLEPAAWMEACRSLDERLHDPGLRTALAHSRARLLEHHAIRPGNEDWRDLFAMSSDTAAAPPANMK